MLKPIKPKRISDQVFEQLKDHIFKGHFKPGEQLMTERDLAQVLGVSRPTVREAMNKLVNLGLVEQRQGQGTFVSSPADNQRKNPLAAVINGQDASLLDLLEVRLGLECNAAALAAQRATEEDIRNLKESLQRMIEEIEQGDLGTNADVSFHMTIAYATKNVMQIYIMKSFYDLMFYGIEENLRSLWTEPGNQEKIIRQHTEIFEAIRRHDSSAAYEAMLQHISFVVDFFKERTP
ncbi:MAG: FadR/GntR family transcriptional regulator [Desulfoferrobacter sp.]